ncbi:MAG: hypothetical protein MRJ93_12045 [Nitrososphaeraceae archaeon]|nr:hypothetical protein [Nitrososphaeraceae archaeon]
MNPKIKIGSMFLLAGILVAGTISTMIPTSFAQSQYRYVPQQEYTGYENSYGNGYDKKQGSDVNIQKVKCNNIIINGVEKSRPTSGDMTGNTMAADENDWIGQQQNHGFGNGEKKFKGFDRNIVNVCINKNNIVAEESVDTCESCIEKTLDEDQITNINNALERAAQQGDPIFFQVGTDDAQLVRSLDQVCEIINNAGGQVTVENINSFFIQVNKQLKLGQDDPIPPDVIRQLILCLQDAGLVVGDGGGGGRGDL